MAAPSMRPCGSTYRCLTTKRKIAEVERAKRRTWGELCSLAAPESVGKPSRDRWDDVLHDSSAGGSSPAAAGCRFQSVFVTSSDVSEGKPHPEPFLRGCRETGVPCLGVCCFGGRPAGIRAGKAPDRGLSLSGQPFGIQNCVARGRLGAGRLHRRGRVDKTARLTLRLNG